MPQHRPVFLKQRVSGTQHIRHIIRHAEPPIREPGVSKLECGIEQQTVGRADPQRFPAIDPGVAEERRGGAGRLNIGIKMPEFIHLQPIVVNPIEFDPEALFFSRPPGLDMSDVDAGHGQAGKARHQVEPLPAGLCRLHRVA